LRYVIFANGVLPMGEAAKDLIGPEDVVVAADGGAHHCQALGIVPQVVVGDFDSLAEDDLAALEADGAQLIHHPPRKDQTDLELALLYAVQQGADEALVLGGLGARWDQTLANLLLAAHRELRGLKLVFVHGGQRLCPIHGEGMIEGQAGDTVSLIPIGGDAEGVSTQGLEYPLEDETLHLGSSRGVSNVLLGERAEVRVKKGLLLCVVLRGQGSGE